MFFCRVKDAFKNLCTIFTLAFLRSVKINAIVEWPRMTAKMSKKRMIFIRKIANYYILTKSRNIIIKKLNSIIKFYLTILPNIAFTHIFLILIFKNFCLRN